ATGTHMEEWSVVGSAATLIREVAMPVTARPGSLQTITYDSDRALVWASDSGAAAAEGLVALNATTFAHTGLFPLPADNGGSFLTSDIAFHSGDGWIWVVSVDEEACALDPENNAS